MNPELTAIFTAMDIACGRPADPLRAKSLALVLEPVVPLQWLVEGCREVACTKESTDFPATAAEIHRAAWKAAGFRAQYLPQCYDDSAYREPRLGGIRWWPVARLSGDWERLSERWDEPASSLGLPSGSVLVPDLGLAQALPALPSGAKGSDAEGYIDTNHLADEVVGMMGKQSVAPKRAPRKYASGSDFLREWEGSKK